MYSHVNSHVI